MSLLDEMATMADHGTSMIEKVIFSSEGYQLSGSLFEAYHSEPKAVVLSHGAFEHKGNWKGLALYLAGEGFTTLTFDFAGHGESEGLRGFVDMRVWAYNIRDAMNYLASRGYHRFGLVGWNHGGCAVVLAVVHDVRVSCAVTLSTPVFLMPPLSDRIVLGLTSIAGGIKKAFWRRPLTLSRTAELERMCVAIDEEANQKYINDPQIRQCYQAVPLPESLHSVWLDITRAAQKISKPMLVIHSLEDAIIPVEQGLKLHGMLRGEKQLILIKSSGHAIHLDRQRNRVNNQIVDWISKYLN